MPAVPVAPSADTLGFSCHKCRTAGADAKVRRPWSPGITSARERTFSPCRRRCLGFAALATTLGFRAGGRRSPTWPQDEAQRFGNPSARRCPVCRSRYGTSSRSSHAHPVLFSELRPLLGSWKGHGQHPGPSPQEGSPSGGCRPGSGWPPVPPAPGRCRSPGRTG